MPQIREQMSGPKISWCGKSILGCGLWPVAWAGLWNKRVWADYEQLFWAVFSIFHGQIIIFFNFFLHCSVRTEELHKIKLFLSLFFGGGIFFSCFSLFFIGCWFHSKYIKVGYKHLFSYLWYILGHTSLFLCI